MSSMFSILIAGDLVPIGRVANLLDEKHYYEVFGQVKSLADECDFSIVNLEAPIVETNKCVPIKKSGPNLKTNNSVIEALKYSGFDAVTLANNHFRDYGNQGCQETLHELVNNDIKYVGGGVNIKDAKRTMYHQFSCNRGGGNCDN